MPRFQLKPGRLLWSVNGVNSENLIRKLQGLTNLGSVALVDAVERYWARERVNPNESLQTRLLQVDLIKCCDFAP